MMADEYDHGYQPMRVYPEGWVDDPDSVSGKGVFKFWGGNEDFEQPDAWVEPDMDTNQWEWGYNHPTIPELRGEGRANSRDEAIAAAEEHHQHTQNRPGNYEYKPTGFEGFRNTSSRVPNFVRISAPRAPIEYQYENNGWQHAVKALRNGQMVGYLSMAGPGNRNPEGMISGIDVMSRYRRRGIGRGMIEHALANGVQPLHSDALLKDGKAFANAVPLPRVWENSDGYKIVPWEHGEPGGGDPNAYRVPVGDGTWRFDGQKFRQDFDAAPEWKPGVGAALYPKQIKSSKVIKTAVRWEDWAAENPGNNLEFRHRINNATFAGEPGADHRIEAILNGKRVGYADIAGEDSDHHSPGEIQMVSVDEPYRMRGIGRSMLQHAHKMGLNPTHSAFLTPDGMEFAEATPEYPSAEDYAWA